MKNKKHPELDVDFIGSQVIPLTKEEEQAISQYLKTSKNDRKKIRVSHKNRQAKKPSPTS